VETHKNHLRQVISALYHASFHLVLGKCELFKSHIKFLGIRVGEGKTCIDKDRLSGIESIAWPHNVTELRTVMGLFETMHQFVPHLATIAKPMTDLLRGGGTKLNKWDLIKWTDAHDETLNSLKASVRKHQELMMFDPNFPLTSSRIILKPV
jgi:hypothetical protein